MPMKGVEGVAFGGRPRSSMETFRCSKRDAAKLHHIRTGIRIGRMRLTIAIQLPVLQQNRLEHYY